jgi:hypothetical protein
MVETSNTRNGVVVITPRRVSHHRILPDTAL